MKKQVVIHPVLFSLYPIALLYSTNFGLIEFPDVIGTALASVCLSVLSWWGRDSLYFRLQARRADCNRGYHRHLLF